MRAFLLALLLGEAAAATYQGSIGDPATCWATSGKCPSREEHVHAGVRCSCFEDAYKCSCADEEKWAQDGINMGFSDFDPATVNWKIPVLTTLAGTCTKDEQSGCILGYGGGLAVMLGFGVFFTFFTLLLNFVEGCVRGTELTSEHFNTAGRNIKIGLTASVIVSQWTWAATLLQSSNKAWQVGVSGPFWYASGATVQVLLFGILAVEVKRKCPNAHTFLEIIDARWGTAAHLTFLVFACMTSILVTGMLLLGGAAVMNAASGIDKRLCSFLIPWGVVFYTVAGGLKATFLAGYCHTAIIMAGLATFITTVYCLQGDRLPFTCDTVSQCNVIGSASAMYERLAYVITVDYSSAADDFQAAYDNFTNKAPWTGSGPEPASCSSGFFGHQGPVATNRGGSYLTMLSESGFMFGVINTVGNFGTVFVDQSYWQSAIAASPASAHKGYLLGGLVWFTIPFALATSLGLAGVALNGAIGAELSGQGLTPPISATILLGNGGGVLTIIMLFMAITSTGSAECISVSSLIVYDVYRRYINPDATGNQILRWSRVWCFIFGIGMGLIAVVFNAFTVEEKKLVNTLDAGYVCSKNCKDGCKWVPTCDPPINVNLSMGWVYVFMGNMIGSAVVPVFWSITWKDCNKVGAIAGAWGGLLLAIVTWIGGAQSLYCDVNYWSLFQDEPLLIGNLVAILGSMLICWIISKLAPQNYDWALMNEKIRLVEGGWKPDFDPEEMKPENLQAALDWSHKYGWGVTLFLIVVWPCMLGFPLGVFSKGVYQAWVAVAFAWGWLGTIVIIFMPLMESWDTIKAVVTCAASKKRATATDKDAGYGAGGAAVETAES